MEENNETSIPSNPFSTKSADFIILDRDITVNPPAGATVTATYFRGVKVFGK